MAPQYAGQWLSLWCASVAKSRLSLGGFPEEEKGLCRRGWKLRKSERVIWLLPSLDIHHTHTHTLCRGCWGPETHTQQQRGEGLNYGTWGRGEAGWALKVQGRVVWPSGQVRREATLPLCSFTPRLHYSPSARWALQLVGLGSPKALSLRPLASVPLLCLSLALSH